MKLKSMVLLALALGCGLVAMLGVQQVLSRDVQDPNIGKVQVLVARQEIDPGTRLDETNVAFDAYPEERVPQGAVMDAKQFEERAAKVRIYPGEVVLEAKLGPKGSMGAATSIPKGLRVVTVPVNATSANSGMINPGDRVDILVTYKMTKSGTGTQVTRTRTVLQYVQVFALDRLRDADSSDANKGNKAENLSVIVTPEQASLLMMASNKGTLQMSLRSAEDKDEIKTAFIDDEIFEGNEASKGPEVKVVADDEDSSMRDFREFVEKSDATPEPVEPETPKNYWTMEIWHGTEKVVEKVELLDTAAADAESKKEVDAPAAKDKPAAPSA